MENCKNLNRVIKACGRWLFLKFIKDMTRFQFLRTVYFLNKVSNYTMCISEHKICFLCMIVCIAYQKPIQGSHYNLLFIVLLIYCRRKVYTEFYRNMRSCEKKSHFGSYYSGLNLVWTELVSEIASKINFP